MTSQSENTKLESYVPVYESLPDKWEDAQTILVENMKKISNGINNREIGWYLDEELLTGKSFIPGQNNFSDGGTSEQFRSILRKIVVVGEITVAGNTNVVAHGITVDDNFTLIQLWASATNSTTFRSVTFSNPDTIWLDADNINIVTDDTYDRCNAFIEYIQEQ